MANQVYPKFKDAAYTGAANVSLNVDTATDGPYAVLLDAGIYTYNPAHEFYTSLAAGLVGTEQRITAPTLGVIAPGRFDGADVTFPSVGGGVTVEAVGFYRRNSGANTTWRLILYIDTAVTNLPVTTNGGDIELGWSSNGIVAL